MIEFDKTISESEYKSGYLNLNDDRNKLYGPQFGLKHLTRIAIKDTSGGVTYAQMHHTNQLWGMLRSWFDEDEITPGVRIKVRFDPTELHDGIPIVHLVRVIPDTTAPRASDNSPQATDPFTNRALKIYEDAKTEIGYVAHRFRQKIVRDGGLAAVKHWLRPSKVTTGFQRLLDHDRLDLSVEAVALQSSWSKYFTPAELATARERLAQFGYFTRPTTPPTPSTQLSPDELADGASYPEGAKTQITVSAYERNPEARQKCIQHYGAICYVCGFDFGKTYGDMGQGFIHVHHLTPFASLADERRTDPVTDLRPVCPNCHSMLHRRNPPIPIAKLKEIIRDS